MRKKKVTMKDVAAAVGVSQPTVSIIINHSDSIKISEKTRKKVLNKAKELGYVLKTNRHQDITHPRIAFVVNNVNMHDPFMLAISAAKTRAWELGYLLVLFDFEEVESLKQAMLAEIVEGHYKGLIYASNSPKTVKHLEQLPDMPIVMLNCAPEMPSTIPVVACADYLGGYRATEHLIKRGYQYIAMIEGESWSEASILRRQGYQQALANADIPAQESWLVYGNWSVRQAYMETLKLLAQKRVPDAIFCASDLMAVGCYQAIAKKGLSIPKDIAVMGYDNQLLASELTPSLSSIDLPYDEMAKKAIEILCDEPVCENVSLFKIKGELYARDST